MVDSVSASSFNCSEIEDSLVWDFFQRMIMREEISVIISLILNHFSYSANKVWRTLLSRISVVLLLLIYCRYIFLLFQGGNVSLVEAIILFGILISLRKFHHRMTNKVRQKCKAYVIQR